MADLTRYWFACCLITSLIVAGVSVGVGLSCYQGGDRKSEAFLKGIGTGAIAGLASTTLSLWVLQGKNDD